MGLHIEAEPSTAAHYSSAGNETVAWVHVGDRHKLSGAFSMAICVHNSNSLLAEHRHMGSSHISVNMCVCGSCCVHVPDRLGFIYSKYTIMHDTEYQGFLDDKA